MSLDAASPLRLLAVEDDPTDRSWLGLMLKEATLCPRTARVVATMADAEAAVRQGKIDCVLLDLSLPDCEGVESVRRILDCDPLLPIVVFTGSKDNELGLRSIEEGAQDYLVKGQASGNTILRSALWAVARVAARSRENITVVATLLDQLVEAWGVVSLDLKVVRANPTFAQLMGMSETDIVGIPITSLVEAGRVGEAVGLFRGLVTGDVPSFVFPTDIISQTGKRVARTLIAAAIKSDRGIDAVLVLLAAPVAADV